MRPIARVLGIIAQSLTGVLERSDATIVSSSADWRSAAVCIQIGAVYVSICQDRDDVSFDIGITVDGNERWYSIRMVHELLTGRRELVKQPNTWAMFIEESADELIRLGDAKSLAALDRISLLQKEELFGP